MQRLTLRECGSKVHNCRIIWRSAGEVAQPIVVPFITDLFATFYCVK